MRRTEASGGAESSRTDGDLQSTDHNQLQHLENFLSH